MAEPGPTVLVVGNCQAGPLAWTMRAMVPSIRFLQTVTVQNLPEARREQTLEDVRRADIVFSQLVRDDYPTDFVRTSTIEREARGQVVKWVNMFWSGETPELAYKRKLDAAVTFPLSLYHSETILEAYLEGAPVAEALRRLADPDWNAERYGHIPEESLEELRDRERSADVAITDRIDALRRHRRLFNVFNHPTMVLIEAYAARLLRAVGLHARVRLDDGQMDEPLNQFIAPLNPASDLARARRAAGFENFRTYRSRRTTPDGTKRAWVFGENGMVTQSYLAYDRIGRDAVREAAREPERGLRTSWRRAVGSR